MNCILKLHESVKFKYQLSKTNITFLDTEIYTNTNTISNYMQKHTIRNKIDRQTFFRIKPEHLKYFRIYLKTKEFQ